MPLRNPAGSTANSRLTCCRAVQIIALGVSYFVAVSALDVITNVGTIDDLTSLARMLLVLPVAALDGVFILWVFTSLSRTLNQLQARHSGSKLELYRCGPLCRVSCPHIREALRSALAAAAKCLAKCASPRCACRVTLYSA